jgi:hypothetical protein
LVDICDGKAGESEKWTSCGQDVKMRVSKDREKKKKKKPKGNGTLGEHMDGLHSANQG